MAVILDEDEAKSSPCTCYYIGNRRDLKFPIHFKKSLSETGIPPEDVICFSKGMLGALSNEQDLQYCNGGVIKYSERLVDRLKCLKKCLERC